MLLILYPVFDLSAYNGVNRSTCGEGGTVFLYPSLHHSNAGRSGVTNLTSLEDG
jgi:hypothetical protein